MSLSSYIYRSISSNKTIGWLAVNRLGSFSLSYGGQALPMFTNAAAGGVGGASTILLWLSLMRSKKRTQQTHKSTPQHHTQYSIAATPPPHTLPVRVPYHCTYIHNYRLLLALSFTGEEQLILSVSIFRITSRTERVEGRA